MCKRHLKVFVLVLSLVLFFASCCWATNTTANTDTNEDALTSILTLSIEARSILAELKASSISKEQNLRQLCERVSYYEQKELSFESRYRELENKFIKSEQSKAVILTELQDLRRLLDELSILRQQEQQKAEARIRRLIWQRNISLIITGLALAL